MAGIYGRELEDRYFERMLHRHLDDRYDPEEYERRCEEAEYYNDLRREERLIDSALKALEEATSCTCSE